VLYDSGDVARYDEPYLYKLIKNWLQDENYYVVKRYHSRMVNDITTKYPMITDVNVDYRSSNTVFVKLTFRPIDMVIRNQELRYALIDGRLFPLYSGNAIANGIKILDMPEYMSGINDLTGIFYKLPAAELTQQIELLYQ